MIPTCYLRQVEMSITVPHESEEDMYDNQLTGYRLQQWWYDKQAEIKARPMAEVPDRVEPDWGYGEWRDVEIVQ